MTPLPRWFRPLRRPFALLACILGLTPASSAFGWGSVGHRAIAAQYGETLPEPLQALRLNDQWVYDHVMDPDSRKGSDPHEGYRHFIDIDYYPEYFTGTLSHDRATLEAQYGVLQVEQWGIVPWAIGYTVDSMTVNMAAGNWDRVRYFTADLCHYVGDSHQPLHCTKNYDGQFTGNNGIHSRYESTMLNQYTQFLQFDAATATYFPNVVDAAFTIAGESQVAVQAVLTADTEAKAAAGGVTSGSTYYAGLWSRTQTLTLARMTQASQWTASFVYTAWVNAGYPAVPGSTVDVGDGVVPGTLALSASPSPTTSRGTVTVSYSLPRAASASLVAYDVEGRQIARLVDGLQPAGPSTLTWRPAHGMRAGIVFLRLVQGPSVTHTRVVVLP